MKDLTQKGKYLALILRHAPERAKVTLNSNGWARVEDLTDPSKGDFKLQDLLDIVRTDSKGRYEFNPDKTMLRATQGHSLKNIEIELEHAVPPGELFHGTKEQFMSSIMKQGLKPVQRQFVHLSTDKKTAAEVAGRRKGTSVILKIDSCQMAAKEHKFYLSSNGVWLTNHVPPKFISEC